MKIIVIIFMSIWVSSIAWAKPTVVVTFSVLADWVSKVGGEDIQMTALVGANQDVHNYELTPQDMVKITQADLIFANGLGYESWLKKMVSLSQGKVMYLADDLPNLIELEEHAHDDHGHHHGDVDPHVWHDVGYAIQMIDKIVAGLSTIDPERQEQYYKRGLAYQEELRKLDEWINQEIALIPVEHRRMVTAHDTMGYLARRYGLKVMATVIQSTSTEAVDLSAKDMQQLIETLKAENMRVIFTENIKSQEVASILAQEASVIVADPLYTDSLGDINSGAHDYLSMMRYNVLTIKKFLSK